MATLSAGDGESARRRASSRYLGVAHRPEDRSSRWAVRTFLALLLGLVAVAQFVGEGDVKGLPPPSDKKVDFLSDIEPIFHAWRYRQ